MFKPRVLRMLDHADSEGRLYCRQQAKQIWDTEHLDESVWIEADFDGVRTVTAEFVAAFFQIDGSHQPAPWIVPKHYERIAGLRLGGYLDKLQHHRDRMMREAFAPSWS